MNIELLYQPDSAIARIVLDAGEELVAQAGAMIAMSGFINARFPFSPTSRKQSNITLDASQFLTAIY